MAGFPLLTLKTRTKPKNAGRLVMGTHNNHSIIENPLCPRLIWKKNLWGSDFFHLFCFFTDPRLKGVQNVQMD